MSKREKLALTVKYVAIWGVSCAATIWFAPRTLAYFMLPVLWILFAWRIVVVLRR